MRRSGPRQLGKRIAAYDLSVLEPKPVTTPAKPITPPTKAPVKHTKKHKHHKAHTA